jgi:hypothetical protein
VGLETDRVRRCLTAARARDQSRAMVGSRDGAIEKFHNSSRDFPIRVGAFSPIRRILFLHNREACFRVAALS